MSIVMALPWVICFIVTLYQKAGEPQYVFLILACLAGIYGELTEINKKLTKK